MRWEVGQLLWDTHQVIQVNCAAKCKNQLFYKFNGRGVVRSATVSEGCGG